MRKYILILSWIVKNKKYHKLVAKYLVNNYIKKETYKVETLLLVLELQLMLLVTLEESPFIHVEGLERPYIELRMVIVSFPVQGHKTNIINKPQE